MNKGSEATLESSVKTALVKGVISGNVTGAAKDVIKDAVTKKILFTILGSGAAVPLLILLLILLVIITLLPAFFFAGDEVLKVPVSFDSYYGAESGGASFKISGKGTLRFPVAVNKITITSGFGNRIHPITHQQSFHTGIDISCDLGTPIHAAADGTVESAENGGAYGNLIILRNKDQMQTYYAHLQSFNVKKGDIVKGGDLIGYSGNTGASTGPHLHFETRIAGEAVDPSGYLGLSLDIPEVLPEDLMYKEINTKKLRDWLKRHNSMLADEPYFSTIINTAKLYNLSAILMFAIPGQEQSLVPRNSPEASRIAANPYNVFHSWQEYNTDIGDSARIAAKTIINLSQGRPASVNPLAWINTRGGKGGYAEDTGWWIGVSKFMAQIKAAIE